MKIKKVLFYKLIYFIFVLAVCFIIHYLSLTNKFIKYISFNTEVFNFQDLLSISITILSIFVGAIITVATVLISMCDKRILKLIKQYKKSKNLVSTIKVAISTGIILIFLLAIVYSQLDFKVLILRLLILYISGFLLLIFIIESKTLIHLIINVLNDAFDENDSIIVKPDFKRPDKKNETTIVKPDSKKNR